MSNSNFVPLTSLDGILSGHINALAAAVKRLEDLFGMHTDTVSDHELSPITDQLTAGLRYRIYESPTYKNWVGTPVIKVNGVTVEATEYTFYEGYGIIVFNAQQLPASTVTADFTFIKDSESDLTDIIAGL